MNQTKSHFTYPGGMKARDNLDRAGIEPGPPAHMSEHVSERLTP